MINEESAQASLIASKLAYSYGPLGGQLPGYQCGRKKVSGTIVCDSGMN